jgi:serine/threonine protein phosphatase PrpC
MMNVVRKFAFATKVGNQDSGQNQDSFILIPNLQQKQPLHFFAVCDGHGPKGAQVAEFLREVTP